MITVTAMSSPPEEVSKPKRAKTVSPSTPSRWEPPVTCVLCGGELKDPHLLACLHCLCKECLPRAAREDGRLQCPSPDCGDCSTTWQQPDVVDLPHCEKRARECVPVQCATVSRYVEGRKIVRKVTSGERITCGFPQCDDPGAEATVFCSVCWLFFCGSCEKGHKWMQSMKGEQHDVKSMETIRSVVSDCPATVLHKAPPLCCPRHKEETLKYLCKVCDLLMCQACTVDKDSPHHPAYLGTEMPLPRHLHAVVLAKKVASRSKVECRVAKETAEGWHIEVERKKEEALRDTRQSFQAIRAAIDHREEELCEKIRFVSEARKEGVTGIIHFYREKEDTLSNKQGMLSFLSTEGSPHEIISYHSLLNAGQIPHRSEAAVSRVMQFQPKQETALRAAIEDFGCVEVGASPANCTLEPTPDKLSTRCPIAFTLTIASQEGNPCSIGGEMVQAFLCPRPPISGQSIRAVINDEENGQYRVTFNIAHTGECELSVLVNGAPIQGSPFAVELDPETDVRLLLTRDVNTLGACKGRLQFLLVPGNVWGVAVAPNGTIFVTDYSKCKIYVFDAVRKLVRSFGEYGDRDGQLKNPRNLAIATEGLLYVANNKRVDVLRDNGVFVRRIGAGILSRPWDVTLHNDEIFVADWGSDHVATFSQEGKLVRTIGTTGTGPGQFRCPAGVAVSPNGELYVSDYNNDRVQVFTPNGVYVREFGNGQVRRPFRLQFSSDNHVLVADNSNNRVVIFNHDGALVSSLPCGERPRGLAVDQKGDLLVACYDGKCVQIF